MRCWSGVRFKDGCCHYLIFSETLVTIRYIYKATAGICSVADEARYYLKCAICYFNELDKMKSAIISLLKIYKKHFCILTVLLLSVCALVLFQNAYTGVWISPVNMIECDSDISRQIGSTLSYKPQNIPHQDTGSQFVYNPTFAELRELKNSAIVLDVPPQRRRSWTSSIIIVGPVCRPGVYSGNQLTVMKVLSAAGGIEQNIDFAFLSVDIIRQIGSSESASGKIGEIALSDLFSGRVADKELQSYDMLSIHLK